MEEKKNQIVELSIPLLHRAGYHVDVSIKDVETMAGDGSQRQFFRLSFADSNSVVAVLPSAGDQLQERDEARSAWYIGNHLYRACVPVPEPIGYDPASGLVLFEDLGNRSLYDICHAAEKTDNDTVRSLYIDVTRELAHMQVVGMEGFDVSWCWQTPYYDRQLMLERESGYFYQSLCRDFFQLEPDVDLLYREFNVIADHSSAAPSCFFLHRDFQSRNIMISDGKVRFIDYQGGRLGPLGYDLASLLIDPYVDLESELQELLFESYFTVVQQHVAYERDRFEQEYIYLALQRNLQILGAFSFLGKQRGKTFFLPFIRPALLSLHDLLAQAGRQHYPVLTQITETCLEKRELHDS